MAASKKTTPASEDPQSAEVTETAEGTAPADGQEKADQRPADEVSENQTTEPSDENKDAAVKDATPEEVAESTKVVVDPAFQPLETNHTPLAFNTLHEQEGGSEQGVAQTSGDAHTDSELDPSAPGAN